jgi:transcriptional regulator with XRE-family HTH domain
MNDEYNKQVGSRIYTARKNLKMSRAKLGEAVSLHETTVKRYEDGDIKSLDIEKIKEFAYALSVTPELLLGWKDTDKELVYETSDIFLLAGYDVIPMENGLFMIENKDKKQRFPITAFDLDNMLYDITDYIEYIVESQYKKRQIKVQKNRKKFQDENAEE